MHSYGMGEWAVIEGGVDNKVDVINLVSYQQYEWDNFSIMKERATDNIKWFLDREDAVDFVLENFDKAQISPELIPSKNDLEGYYF